MQLEAHLQHLESRLLQSDVRASAGELAALLADDFFEFGASGTVWNRDAIIRALADEAPARRSITDFKLTRLADDIALVTYRLHRSATASAGAADSLRSSIWKQRDDTWEMVFHQGTPQPRIAASRANLLL